MESHEDHQLETNQLITKKQVFVKINLLAILITLIMLFITSAVIGIFVYFKFNNFSQAANVPKTDFYQTLTAGWKQTPTETKGYKNLLILGVDTLKNRGESTPLTDSIMLVSVNFQTGKIIILPLPRDLWNEDYQTKINALYAYGLDRYSDNPQKFPQEVISEMTDLDIHHTLVVSMETVAEIVDLVGGVEVDVEQGFVDQEFPRTDVDVTVETDLNKLYETIEFKSGLQTMDGRTALKYMRSRHGDNDQNTDLSRSHRQQAIIQALAGNLINQATTLNTSLLGQLYRYYLDNFASDLSPVELIASGKALLPMRSVIKLENRTISIYPEDSTGIIEHPPQYLYDGQWVYAIRDKNEFKLNVQSQLTK